MTQLHLIEQAKQGDPQAIAALMNKSLQPKGMTALVDRHNDRLDVVLEAERVPNRQALTEFVEKGISNLGIPSIKSIKVSGQQIGAMTPAWTHELQLETPVPEFEPEAEPDTSSAMWGDLSSDGILSDELPTSPPESEHEFDFSASSDDFNMEFGEQSVHGEQPLSDLSQLSDLLSDQPEQPISDTQRQELEGRIESLWAEQSDEQSQDFLSELMAGTPEEPTVQFEDFPEDLSAMQPPSEQAEGFWAEQPETPSSDALGDDFLLDLNGEATNGSADEFNGFFDEQPHGSTESSSEGWLEEEGPIDEPDEVLFSFMDDQPQPPSMLGLDETGEPIDEPDEILLGFLPDEPGQTLSTSEGMGTERSELESLSDLPSEDELVDFFGDTSDSTALTDSTEDVFMRGSSLDTAPDVTEQDTTEQDTSSSAEDWFAEQPQEEAAPEAPVEDWFAEQPMSGADNGFFTGQDEPFDSAQNSSDEFLNLPDEQSFGETSLTFDESSTDLSEEPTDFSAELWNQPAIEFLQDEPEPPSPDMPTEQLYEPLAGFTSEPEESSAGMSLDEQLNDFPQDFLREPSEELSGDQSAELFVDPHENPFMEHMEENRERSEEFRPETPDETADQFNSLEWQSENELDFSSDLLAEQPQDSTEEPLFESLESSDDLSEESLVDFFATEPQMTDQTTPQSADFETESSFSEFSDDASLRSPEWGLDEPTYSSSSIPTQPPELVPGSLDDETNLQLDNEDLGFETSSGAFAAGAASSSMDMDIPDSVFSASGTSGFEESDLQQSDFQQADTQQADTQLPDRDLSDTQLPAREEPSQEALEAQLAGFNLEEEGRGRTGYGYEGTAAEEPRSETRNSPWLFPLILLGISGWIVGLISFAFLWSRLSSPPPLGEDAAETAQPTDPSAATGVAATCNPPAETAATTPVALSSLQFQPNPDNPQQINLVGCVTNRTQQPIDIVSVNYRAGSSATLGGLSFPDNVIQPGQTVPFSSKFTLPSDITNVNVETIYWQPSGASASQEASTSIQLNR